MLRNAPLRIMLTGKDGQIGWELQRAFAPLGKVVALGRRQLDLSNPDQIRERVREIKPNLIVNAAAYTDVDMAEEESELATVINGLAPCILAEEAKRISAAVVHYSTDYVFDGTKTRPYIEEDKPNPINVYGKTKMEGERAIQLFEVPHIILRTSWVYGMRGKNFLLTILRLAKERDELKIINDQIGAPTWSRMIAEVTAQMLGQIYSPLHNLETSFRELSGIYHLSAGGQTSWYGFAKAILETYQHLYPNSNQFKVRLLKPIKSKEYFSKTCRPTNSRLDCTQIRSRFNICLPSWKEGLMMTLDSGKQ